MPRSHATLFDRERDERVNGAKATELHKYGLTCYWLLVSPVECQALADGVVCSDLRLQAAQLLKPGVGE